MKRNFFAAAILFAVCLSSCKKETATAVAENNDLPQSVQNVQAEPIQDVQKSIISKAPINPLGTGYWIIGSFKMKGKNLTNNYRGYQFQFQENDLLVATKPSDRTYGNWSMVPEVSLSINFGKGDLSELDENWAITQKTEKTIFLSVPNTLKTLRLDAVSQVVVLR